MNSLRLRLVLLLSVALGLAWAASAWFSHVEARSEIDELFDAQLAQSAQVLLGSTRHHLHERSEHEDGEADIETSHAYEQKLAYQIWDEDGLLMRSATAPLTSLAKAQPGYSETVFDGQPWRVFTRWGKHNKLMIQVAEPIAAREQLARHIALKMLLPSLVVLPLLALLIWLAVGRGLRPLRHVRQEVATRAADRLQPLSMAGVPDEVAPLVQALNELFGRLHHTFENERRFTADAAHELRTPLAALKTQAQVAMRSTDDSERRAALENVLCGVDRATHLVVQLLTLARLDPETAMTAHLAVDLRKLAAETIAELAPAAQAKRIDLALEAVTDSTVSGSGAQLAVLLRNLIDNAIRYTPEGGQVTVSLQSLQEGLVLEVRDTGPGIPEQEKTQVLERFYRIPGSSAEGSGLGLSIVRRIVELHGARLVLENGAGGGGLVVKVVF